MELTPINRQWGPVNQSQRGSALICGSIGIALMALGASSLTRAAQGQRAIGAGLLGLGVGSLVLCLLGMNRRPEPMPLATVPHQSDVGLPPAPVQGVEQSEKENPPALEPVPDAARPSQFELVKRAVDWAHQHHYHRSIPASQLQFDLIDAFRRCRDPDNDDPGKTYMQSIGNAIGTAYCQGTHSLEEAQWQFLQHVAASEGLRTAFVEAPGHTTLPLWIWTVIIDHHCRQFTERGLSLDACAKITGALVASQQGLLNRDCHRNPHLEAVVQRGYQELYRHLIWSWCLMDDRLQTDVICVLVETCRRMNPIFWPLAGASFANAPGDRQHLELGWDILTRAAGMRHLPLETLIVHQATCLTQWIRTLRQEPPLARAAVGIAGMAHMMVTYWENHQPALIATPQFQQTGLLTEINATLSPENQLFAEFEAKRLLHMQG